MDTIIASLDDLVGDQLQPVSYKWLARHFDVPYDVSKQILFHYLSKKSEKVKATFLVSGWTKEEKPRHVVRLVNGGALEDAKAQLTVITAMHVYSVQPATSKDSNGLYSTEFSQSEELFRKMVAASAAEQDGNPLGCRLSKVRCTDSQRAAVAVAGPPALNPAVVPAVKKTATPTPAKSKPKAAAPAAKKETAPAKKKAEPKPKAASTVAAAKKKADSKPSSAATKKDAPAKQKRTIVDDSEDSEDEEKTTTQTAAAEEPAAAAAAPPPAKKAKQAPAKAAKKPAAAGSKRKQPTIEESNAAGKAAGEENEAASSKEAFKAGTIKVHADQLVGKRKKRVMKTYFNDAGEEVTEMTEETDDEAPEPQVAEQKEESKPSPQAENKAPGGASGSTKPASEAPAGAAAPSGGGGGGGKKASKNAAGAANQRSIASFFSKK